MTIVATATREKLVGTGLAVLCAAIITSLFIKQLYPVIPAIFAIILAEPMFRRRWRSVWEVLRPLLLALFIAFLFSTVVSINSTRSIQGVRDVVIGLLLIIPFYVLVQKFSKSEVFYFFSCACIFFCAAMIVGLFVHMAVANVSSPLRLIELNYGFWRNQNYLGSQLGLNAVLLLVLIVRPGVDSKLKLFAGIVMFCSLLLLASLHVRGAMVAFVIAIPVVVMSKGFWRSVVLLTILLMLVAALFFGVLYSQDIQACFPFLFHDPSDLSNGRLEFYSNVFKALSERPLFGWGFNTFKLSGYGGLNRAWGNEFHTYPHSVYLEMLYSFGIIGTLAIAAGVLRVSKKIGWHFDGAVALMGKGVLAFILARGLFDIQLADSEFPAAMGVVLGIFLGVSERSSTTSEIEADQPCPAC